MARCEADGECAGGECLCRGEETCPSALNPTLGNGYCSTADCNSAGCREDEVCLDFSVPGAITGGQNCVTGCVGCAFNGYSCRQVPSTASGSLTWEDACFPNYPKRMGRSCEDDSDCMGGTCLNGPGNPLNGYCTLQDCSDDLPCPNGSQCVLKDGRGYICARNCGDGTPGVGDCPIDVTDDSGLDVSCQFLEIYETGELSWSCAPR